VEDVDEPVREGAQGFVVGTATVPLSPRQERRLNQVDPITPAAHLRLVWPQWQGAGTESVRSLAPEFPFDIARRGYSVGTTVLQAVLPEHDGPTAVVPVEIQGSFYGMAWGCARIAAT
jgi:hypothetical protein